jgi:membrane fusion protein (multidrug efflux system)
LFSDITVDPNTGMLGLRAEFPNPDRLLLPGMFARARLEQAVNEEAITVPMRAVARAAEGNATVLVVGADNKVEARPLKLGDAAGDSWIVTAGLRAGEIVIVEGVQKARPGATVKPVPVPPSTSSASEAGTSGATRSTRASTNSASVTPPANAPATPSAPSGSSGGAAPAVGAARPESAPPVPANQK